MRRAADRGAFFWQEGEQQREESSRLMLEGAGKTNKCCLLGFAFCKVEVGGMTDRWIDRIKKDQSSNNYISSKSTILTPRV